MNWLRCLLNSLHNKLKKSSIHVHFTFNESHKCTSFWKICSNMVTNELRIIPLSLVCYLSFLTILCSRKKPTMQAKTNYIPVNIPSSYVSYPFIIFLLWWVFKYSISRTTILAYIFTNKDHLNLMHNWHQPVFFLLILIRQCGFFSYTKSKFLPLQN